MNDKKLLDFIVEYSNDHFYDLIDNILQGEVNKMMIQKKPVTEIVLFIAAIYERVYPGHKYSADELLLTKVYEYILDNYGTDETIVSEQLDVLLSIYDGSKSEFLEEYHYLK